CLADHHRFDVCEREARVFERAECRLAQKARHRDVDALGVVFGLADADHAAEMGHRYSPSSTQTRFCWRQWPCVACATARSPSPRAILANASPILFRPHEKSVRVHSDPPDGLIRTSGPRPTASRTTSSCCAYAAASSAKSSLSVPTPALTAASWADGARVRSRTPSAGGSIRWSMPRIQTGRLASLRAESPAAITIAVAPSLLVGQSWSRSGEVR